MSLVADGPPVDADVHAEPGVLRVWFPGGSDPTIVDAAAALPDVVSVTMTRASTVGLVGSRDADGGVVDAPPDGYQIPVSVAAIDPEATAEQLPAGASDLRTLVTALGPGEVLLTETAARLRAIGVGGELALVGRPGLRVTGVVPDATLRRVEVAVHDDEAEALGLPTSGAITVLHAAAPGPATDALIERLTALAPDGSTARVSQPASGAGATSPLVLSLPELKATFGEFAYRGRPGVREIDLDPAFVAEHIVSAQVPLLGTVACHGRIVDDLRAALEELVDAGLGDWVDPRRYGGCFYARRIRPGSDRLSSHTWGAAIDINVDHSMPGLGPVPPDAMIEIFGRHGFRWGGDFTTPDHHHWEWVGDDATERRD
jgi:hypothetical protein